MRLSMLGGITLAALLHCTPAGANERPALAVQLWSVKDDVKRDFDGTLEQLAAMGFSGVEFAGEFGRFANDPQALRAFLARSGLRCAGAHTDLASLDADKFKATTSFYRAAGCDVLIIAMDRRAFTNAGAANVGRELAAMAKRLRPLGMRIGYHNHAEELAGTDGNTPWDVLAQAAGRNVLLQLDVGWASFAGRDPIKLMKRYGRRVYSAHFKAKSPPGTTATPIIGQDRADWPAIADAAHLAGTRWLIVEQEEYPLGMTPMQAVRASLDGLRSAIDQTSSPRPSR